MPWLTLFPKRSSVGDQTASTTRELRLFLQNCVDQKLPVVFTDVHGITHQVYLTRANEQAYKTPKGRDEQVIAITMVETKAEEQEAGATGARLQEQFLLACVDEVLPLTFTDPQGEKRRVFITRMDRKSRRSRKTPNEWAYALTMVDAWAGVWIYEHPDLEITTTVTATIRDAYTAIYDDAQALYGLCVYG